MLNLSDKELDHFSKEAAQEYEPGDVLGERSWERLEIRLDRDLGRVHLNPLRHIRRFPFYYAPAMLVLLGVSYYLVRRTGSPPSPAVKVPAAVVQNPSSSQRPVYKEKSTLGSSVATPALPAEKADGTPMGGGEGVAAGTGAAHSAGANNAASAASAAGAASAGTTAGGRAGANSMANAGAGARSRNHRGRNGQANQEDNTLAIAVPANAGRGIKGKNTHRNANAIAPGDEAGSIGNAGAAGTAGNGLAAGNASAAGNVAAASAAAHGGSRVAAPAKELGRVALQGLRPTKKAAHVSDSALRAFTLKSTAPQLIRKGGAHINRSLEFGVLAAPDFASVNSLAGDRPGSTIGLTVDYNFASHWYIGSGLLLDRKIFSARGQDFHAPPGFYQANGMHGDVDLVKGSFEMLEIPLNLRYDFSVTGSTLFFVSGGLSSYLLTSQNNNYYYHTMFTFRDQCTPVSSPDKSYLFSALNLSVGVETGLSNSLSLLIAPYMKVPIRGVGVGQVQMSTVGINFSLKFAPVISRKRY